MLKLDGLCKRYGSRPVLQNLSLTLQPGEIYGLLGPNGAGKTTTINIICGLLKADQGTVTIAGQPAGEATKRLIGIMPQSNSACTPSPVLLSTKINGLYFAAAGMRPISARLAGSASTPVWKPSNYAPPAPTMPVEAIG